MTRNGKIARLPYDIREELNRRLRDGKPGPALLKWLNEDPECGNVLDEEFESLPITKQNLSEWKQGGYKEWVRKEETRERMETLMEKAADLEKVAGGPSIADRVATLLEVELAVAMEQLDEIKDPKERWGRLKDITRELYRLRREDHHARRLRMAEEQYERRENEAEKKKLLELQESMQDLPLKAALHDGKKDRWKWADWEIRVKHDLPMPEWWTNPKTAEEWAELMRPYWWEGSSAKAKGRGGKGEGGKQAPSVQAPSVQRNSKDQAPKSVDCGVRSAESGIGSPKSKVRSPKSGSHRRDARATKAKKSGRVRPGPTKSGQKSGPVKAGPGKTVEGAEEDKSCTGTVREPAGGTPALPPCAEQPSPQSSDVPRALGAPQHLVNPVESGPVKPGEPFDTTKSE